MGTSPSTRLDLSVSDPSGYEYGVEFESQSFAEGTHRECYMGTLNNPKAPKHNKKIVLKVFKQNYVNENGADYECVKDLEKSIICHEYCIKFNKSMEPYKQYTIPISFPAPLRINIKRARKQQGDDENKLIKKVFNSIPIKIKNHKYLTCQLYLKNGDQYKYNKLTSNNGWMVDKASDYSFLSAFSHYSWAQSKGKLVINAFQGIQRGHVLFLSDAVIHSDELGKHGSNDLGIIGICNFFLNHECNECCKHLPTLNITLLIEYLSQNSILKCNKSTSYLFELNKEEMKKDHVNLETVYAESIQQTFTKKDDKEVHPPCAGQSESEQAEPVIHDKMEQIEHVIEEMHVGDAGIVEEEEDDDEHVVIDQDSDYDDDIVEEEEVHVINPNVNVSWFGEDDEDHESYAEQKDLFDLDANFVNIHHDQHDHGHYSRSHEQQVIDQPVNEPNEWELIN